MPLAGAALTTADLRSRCSTRSYATRHPRRGFRQNPGWHYPTRILGVAYESTGPSRGGDLSSEVPALFRRLTLGVYVVGVAHDEERDAFTAAWVMQTSFDPLLLALSINPGNASYPMLRAGGGFTVNVLKNGQLDLARRFGTRSGKDEDKLAGIRWRPGRTGAPILEDGLAYFDCEVTKRLEAGDHELVLGRVTEGRILAPDAEPLAYADTGDMDGSSALYPRKL